MTTSDGYGLPNAPEFDWSPLPYRPYTPPVSGRFRAMPLLGRNAGDAAAARHCNRNGGHVLTVQGRDIVCLNCPSRWHDEGF